VDIRTRKDIPSNWGGPYKAIKITSVTATVYNGKASDCAITASWFSDFSSLQSDPYLLINLGTEDCYPCRMDAFFDAYSPNGDGSFSKRDSAPGKEERFLIPEGISVNVHTLEGISAIVGPSYLVVGTQGEVYHNSIDWANENLHFVS
jgi:hypothetical protein